jgi:predicted HicB family RNase H-like nuclease
MYPYRVRLFYREPTYESSTEETKEVPYSGSFDVRAPDFGSALQRALSQFAEAQRLSSVGWVREVVRVEIELLAGR